MDLISVFRALTCIGSINAYLGELEDEQATLGMQLKRLAESEFDAGIRAMQQASRSEREMEHLLREARGRLNKAVSLESGLRLAHTHLALSICHANLGDAENAGAALQDVLQVSLAPRSEITDYATRVGAATVGALSTAFLGLGHLGAAAGYRLAGGYVEERKKEREEQERALRELQEDVRGYYAEAAGAVDGDPLPDAKVVCECAECGQQARVPNGAGRIRITCPGCRTVYERHV